MCGPDESSQLFGSVGSNAAAGVQAFPVRPVRDQVKQVKSALGQVRESFIKFFFGERFPIVEAVASLVFVIPCVPRLLAIDHAFGRLSRVTEKERTAVGSAERTGRPAWR